MNQSNQSTIDNPEINQKRQQQRLLFESSFAASVTMPSPLQRPQPPQCVRVGVGVLVRDPVHPHKVFAGIRKGSHGAETLALPGGHLEVFESWQQCATREVLEETNLAIQHVRFGHVTNDIMESENKHYVTIFMMAECVDAETRPLNMEPHKCEGWDSYSWKELKQLYDNSSAETSNELQLFGPLAKLVQEEPQLVLDFLGR